VLLRSEAAAGALCAGGLGTSEAASSSSTEHSWWEDTSDPSVAPQGDAGEAVHVTRVCLWAGYCLQTGLQHGSVPSTRGFAGWWLFSPCYLMR